MITDDEKTIKDFLSLTAEAAYSANAVAQTCAQIMMDKEIITYENAKLMRETVEKNSKVLKALREAIDTFDDKNKKDEYFGNLFKRAFKDRKSLTDEEREILLNSLRINK